MKALPQSLNQAPLRFQFSSKLTAMHIDIQYQPKEAMITPNEALPSMSLDFQDFECLKLSSCKVQKLINRISANRNTENKGPSK